MRIDDPSAQSAENFFNLYYQPAAREARGRLVLRLLCRFRVCTYISGRLDKVMCTKYQFVEVVKESLPINLL